MQFLDVKDVTKNYASKDEENFYFTVTTFDRTLVVRTAVCLSQLIALHCIVLIDLGSCRFKEMD